MEFKKQFGKYLLALVLFVALTIPTAIQFFHMLEGHEHTACNDKTTHIHDSISKCEICTFHITSFDYDLAKYPDLLVSEISVRVDLKFKSLHFHSFNLNNTQLRAPPIFS